jgi:hypothetical protein
MDFFIDRINALTRNFFAIGEEVHHKNNQLQPIFNL